PPRGPLFREGQVRPTDGEAVVAREDEVERPPVAAHPFRRETARLARPDIPILGEVRGRPRPPGLGGVVDPEPTPEPGISGQGLAPEISLEARIVADRRAAASLRVVEDGSATGDV